MRDRTLESIDRVSPVPVPGLANHAAYAMLAQFPAVCFVGALLTDLAYWQTDMFIWETFSIWLLTAGCVMAFFAGVTGLITWFRRPYVRRPRFAGLHILTSLAVVLLSIINAFIHSRDGYTAVVPDGLILSGVVFLLMILATWLGWPRPLKSRPVQNATVVRSMS
jgi:uncharacterized membrane protein